MTFEEDLKRLEPFIGLEKALRLLRAYQMDDADGRRDMEAAIQIQVEKKLGVSPLSHDQALSLPQAAQASGQYVLGTVMAGDRPLYPFGVREDEFIQHMAIFGRSGAGKTNTIALLLKELVCHEIPFMIFDWKRNYRDCLAAPIPIPMIVYTVGRPVHPLRFNPLIPPPGTDIKIWLKKLIEIVSHAYYLGEGVVFLLLEALDHLYESFGCYSNPNPTQYPCMTDVLKHLQETRVTGRKAMWMDSTLRAVQSLCFGQISDVINVSRNDSILDLLDKNVCLELNALGNSEKIFFIETLMVWIHHFRMLEGERETFKHCLIIEEAHNILSASTKETVVDIMLREIRELGEAIVLVDQHPSQMSVPAIGNTHTTIALNAKHSKDLACLGDIMQVPRESRELFSQLPMGRAIVKLQSRYTRPFQIQIPKVALDKGSVTDTDLLQMYQGDYSDSGEESDRACSPSPAEPFPAAHKDEAVEKTESLPELDGILLKDIYDHPLDGVVKRYGRIGVSRRRGNHAKQNLIEKGIIRTVDVSTKTGKVVLLEVTPELKKQLGQKGVAFPSYREGGAVHAYWKAELKKALEQHGWSVQPEKPVGKGQTVDLHAEQQDTCIAVEVEISGRGVDNVMKLLPINYAWILSFHTTEESKVQVRQGLRDMNIHCNHILFATPADYEEKIRFLTARRDLH
jgi:hypothetical protein